MTERFGIGWAKRGTASEGPCRMRRFPIQQRTLLAPSEDQETGEGLAPSANGGDFLMGQRSAQGSPFAHQVLEVVLVPREDVWILDLEKGFIVPAKGRLGEVRRTRPHNPAVRVGLVTFVGGIDQHVLRVKVYPPLGQFHELHTATSEATDHLDVGPRVAEP